MSERKEDATATNPLMEALLSLAPGTTLTLSLGSNELPDDRAWPAPGVVGGDYDGLTAAVEERLAAGNFSWRRPVAAQAEPAWHAYLASAETALGGDYPTEECVEVAEIYAARCLQRARDALGSHAATRADLDAARTAIAEHRADAEAGHPKESSCAFCVRR